MAEAIALEGVEVRVAGAGVILGPVTLRVEAGERWVFWVRTGAARPRCSRSRVRGGVSHVGHTVDAKLRPGLAVRDVVLTGRSSTLETWFQIFGPEDVEEADAGLDLVAREQLVAAMARSSPMHG